MVSEELLAQHDEIQDDLWEIICKSGNDLDYKWHLLVPVVGGLYAEVLINSFEHRFGEMTEEEHTAVFEEVKELSLKLLRKGQEEHP